jgi:hypothetical protein
MRRGRAPERAIASRDRRVGFREPRERILIVCEGGKTEPNYFLALIRTHRLNTVSVVDGRQLTIEVEGTGRSTASLVEYALGRQQSGYDRYAEIWCVFDKDSFPDDDFDNAVGRTHSHAFLRAAWSNEAFELWYVLHFQFLDSCPPGPRGNSRDAYWRILSRELGSYRKNDPELYGCLLSRQQLAIRHARTLVEQYPPGTPPHRRSPATTVHELVERLLSYAPEFDPGQAERTVDTRSREHGGQR